MPKPAAAVSTAGSFELAWAALCTEPRRLPKPQAGTARGFCWLFSLRGVAQLQGGHAGRLLEEGTAFGWSSEEPMPELSSHADQPWLGCLLVFADPLAGDYARFLAQKFGRLQTGLVSKMILHRIERLARDWLAGHAGPALAVHDWLAYWQQWLETHESPLRLIFQLSADAPELRSFANKNVKQLARELGYSRSFLYRKLREQWGQAPAAVLRRHRLDAAATQLLETRRPIQAICTQFGYSSAPKFIAAFKDHHGVTPEHYRRRRKKSALPKTRPSASRPRFAAAQANWRSEGPEKIDTPSAIKPRTTDWDGPYFHLYMAGAGDAVHAAPFELAFNAFIPSFAWLFTLDGEAVFEVGETRVRVGQGTGVFYYQPANARWISPPHVTRWPRVWLHLRGERAEYFFRRLISRHGWLHDLALDSRPVRLAREIVRRVQSGETHPPYVWSALTAKWLFEMEDALASRPSTLAKLDLAGRSSRLFAKPVRTVTDYAAAIGYSRSHLSRKLHQQWKHAPSKVLRWARLEKAAQLLRTTNQPVYAIAKQVNYASVPAFITAFIKGFGVSPSDYRHRM